MGRAGPTGREATPPTPGAVAPAATVARVPDAERLVWGVVAAARGVGPGGLGRLRAAFGSARAILDVARSADALHELRAVLGDAPEPGGDARADPAEGLVAAAVDADATAARLERSGVAIVLPDDPEYPASLRAIDAPPPVLFVEGRTDALADPRAIAVVGTRRPTESGRRIAAQIAAALAACDAVVVSGLAVGIDGAAHAAAVSAGGTTVAVLGGGHEQLYPRAHRRLADAIVAADGAVVSEFAPWARPTRWAFPRRNRVISGLTRATVVVEAGLGSGALITARWALAQGRGCFVVPGPLDAPTSRGCLALLRAHPDVARIVAGVPDLLVDLELVGPTDAAGARGGAAVRREAALAGVGRVEQEVGRLVALGTDTVDALVAATELPVATILAAVTLLEMRGLVVDALGRYRPTPELNGAMGPRRRARVTAARRRGTSAGDAA